MNNLDNLTKIPIKDLLKTNIDARKWVLENIDQLEKLLEIELSNPRFCLNTPEEARPDIIAEENITDKIIIALINLDKRTDKDLTKFIACAAGVNASKAVWIVSNIDDQTKAIIRWLNQKTDEKTAFIILKLSAYTIENSLPAVNLSRI